MRVLKIEDNEIKIILHNCFDDEVEFDVDLTNVYFVKLEVISGDEILTIYDDKFNEIKRFDSDKHFRCMSFYDYCKTMYCWDFKKFPINKNMRFKYILGDFEEVD